MEIYIHPEDSGKKHDSFKLQIYVVCIFYK